MSRQATAWKRRMVNRLYLFEANAPTIQEAQHWHFCRELLRRALEGWADPWVAAHYYTYGLHPAKYRQRVAAEQARQDWQLAQIRRMAPEKPNPQQIPLALERTA